MDYILIGDECSDCSYISNALYFLSLPYKKLTGQEPKSSLLSDSIATFVCKNIKKDYKNKILETASALNKHIISWDPNDSLYQPENGILHFLNMPFNKYELKNILVSIDGFNHHYDIDLANPVFDKLVGESEMIMDIKSLILHVANTDCTVLLTGQSGTGKDVIASCIHQLSNRRKSPFVPINCGAIPAELIESELFGHEKGAFTGAITKRQGRFDIAKGGTLFLDEVGDMPYAMQVKLLRVLQERKMERVGGTQTIDVDVRVIAATHKNLQEMITTHQFREDLYYRLNVFPIQVPSLHERKQDIPIIIEYYLDKIYERLKHRIIFNDEVLNILSEYHWPGNIRELQNFLERMVILFPEQTIDVKKLQSHLPH